jgi:uncharacterized protein (DUF3084 family)
VEVSFWANEAELEHYFQYQKYLMDEYSDKHTSEVLLKQEQEKVEQERKKVEQEREKVEQERKRVEQERKRAEKAEKEKERAEKAERAAQKMAFTMARNLLKLGVEMDQIVQMSGLSEEEIRGNSK